MSVDKFSQRLINTYKDQFGADMTDATITLWSKNAYNNYLLHKACKDDNIDTIQTLINELDNFESRPLHVASRNGNLEAVKFLSFNTPLHSASFKDENLPVVKYLVENGANTNSYTSLYERTPYMISKYSNSDIVMEYLEMIPKQSK